MHIFSERQATLFNDTWDYEQPTITVFHDTWDYEQPTVSSEAISRG